MHTSMEFISKIFFTSFTYFETCFFWEKLGMGFQLTIVCHVAYLITFDYYTELCIYYRHNNFFFAKLD